MANKKSEMGFELIVTLAVVIGFAIIYFVWLKDYRIFGEKLTDYEICKFSNLENAKLKLKIINQVAAERKGAIGNKCKTEYANVPKGKELDTIAKKMAGCWDQYLEGKEDLFETEDNNYCAFCSVLTFEDKKQLTGLTNYLMEKEAPEKGGKKYYEYLRGTSVTNDVFKQVEASHLNELHVIDTSKPQAVIFIMGKTVNPGSLTGTSSVESGVIGGGIGAAAGGIAVGGLLVKTGVGLCLGGIVTGFSSCFAGAFLVTIGGGVGIVAGGTTGYLIGSNYDPNLDTKILLWPYTNEDLSKLKCTKLEGKDRLDIKK